MENTEISNKIDIENNKNELDDAEPTEKNTILNFLTKNSFTILLGISFFLLISFIGLIIINAYNGNLNKIFWFNQLAKYVLILVIQYCMSLLVIHYDVKVNYTRKVIHISYFLWPQLLDITVLKYKTDIFTELWNIWIILYLLILSSEHIRNKNKYLDHMFKAIDRPEDQPYTLIWFSSQIVAVLIILIPFSVYFTSIDKSGLVFIPILINGLADGLAEPIGIRFGKHKYKTKACLSDREYERSYEGSICVFIVSTIILICYYPYMDVKPYIFCLATIPLLITFTEAFSPHTWDSPCIYLVVCSLLSLSLLTAD